MIEKNEKKYFIEMRKEIIYKPVKAAHSMGSPQTRHHRYCFFYFFIIILNFVFFTEFVILLCCVCLRALYSLFFFSLSHGTPSQYFEGYQFCLCA